MPDMAQDNPWLRFAGMWADDPDWDVFQDAMAAERREIDEQSQPK
jgi:hypothetical protein